MCPQGLYLWLDCTQEWGHIETVHDDYADQSLWCDISASVGSTGQHKGQVKSNSKHSVHLSKIPKKHVLVYHNTMYLNPWWGEKGGATEGQGLTFIVLWIVRDWITVPFRGKWPNVSTFVFRKQAFQVGTIHRSQWSCGFSECHKKASNTFSITAVWLEYALSKKIFRSVLNSILSILWVGPLYL